MSVNWDSLEASRIMNNIIGARQRFEFNQERVASEKLGCSQDAVHIAVRRKRGHQKDGNKLHR